MNKPQKTIDCFFNNKSESKKYDVKRYFYLIWTNKYKPDCQAYWTNTKPEKVNFIEIVYCDYIKKGYYFYICGYFSDIDENEYYLTKEKVYKNISYLQSHFQKSIRKQDEQLALSTAIHLFRLDIIHLLHRLPIIMLEDVILHESFTTIIWLMIAISQKNKFKIKKYIYEWLLGIIYLLCKINEKNIINEKNTDNKNIIENLNNYSKLNCNECSILYSIHLRIAYGGIDKDLKMLQYFAYQFYENKEKYINKNEIRPISIFVKELDLQDWNLSAIDYNCNSKLISLISKKFNNIREDEIKKIIWYNSSSINKREKTNNYNLLEWNKIKSFVEKTQRYLLDSYY